MSDVPSLAAGGMVSAPVERRADAQTATSASSASTLSRLLPGALLLLGLMCAVPAIYFPYVTHNLPVAGNVDERTSLAVLERFHHGSLDPQFFMYPTLYYYVTYLFVALINSSKILVLGRTLNLAFVGLTAFAVFAFCARHLGSRAAGLIAAVCVLGSTTVTNSGAYLCTDVLLAAATIAALYFLTSYFEQDSFKAWLAGMLLLGAAVGCKYTAFLLFVAYCLAEWIVEVRVHREGQSRAGRRFGSKTLAMFLLAAGAVFMLAGLFFPVSTTLGFVARTRTNADLRSTSDYLAFLNHLRRMLEIAGAGLAAIAVAVLRLRLVYACLSPRRIYAGLGLVVLVSYLSTPFSLMDPKRFIYDLGALARSNIVVGSNHAQWGNYAHWLIANESGVLLLLSCAGMVVLARRRQGSLVLVGVYVLLYVSVIGSAHLGFARYLTPLLPLVYCASGVGLVWLWKLKGFAVLPKVAAVALGALACAQVGLRVDEDRRIAEGTDAFRASYQLAQENATGQVLYAGYAPSVELEESGWRTRQVSWASLAPGSAAQQLECGQVLIFDQKAARVHGMRVEGEPGVTVLLDDPRGDGQVVVRRSDCR